MFSPAFARTSSAPKPPTNNRQNKNKPMVLDAKSCQSCGVGRGATKLFRCRDCQQVLYCSIVCQRIDWKRGHKRVCSAWVGLQRLTYSAPTETLEREYHVAKRAAQELALLEIQKRDDNQQGKKSSRKGQQGGDARRNESLETSQDRAIGNSSVLPTPPEQYLHTLRVPNRVKSCKQWKICVEDMPHLGCLQLILRPTEQQQTMCAPKLSVAIRDSSPEESLLCLSHETKLFDSIELVIPKRLDNSAIRVRHDDSLFSIRVGYQQNHYDNNDLDYSTSPMVVVPEAAKLLCCKNCGWTILHNHAAIQTVLPLPSPGRWDDIQDYLTCYEGQACFDFGSVSCRPDLLLEDTTVLVVHPSLSNATVLHICPYGSDPNITEAQAMDGSVLVRGTRPWCQGGSSDSTETLSCSQCAQVLGFATEDACRFYKHQLCVGKHQQVQTISTFVAHELVRYAETKAIFSFTCLSTLGRSLHLQLVSWDTLCSAPTRKDACTGPFSCQEWYRTAKVLFEVKEDGSKAGIGNGTSGHAQQGQVGSDAWLWTKGDWCCPPPTKENQDAKKEEAGSTGQSVTELHIQEDEWRELVKELEEGTELIPTEVKKATIAAKLGRDAYTRVGLSAILLT